MPETFLPFLKSIILYSMLVVAMMLWGKGIVPELYFIVSILVLAQIVGLTYGIATVRIASRHGWRSISLVILMTCWAAWMIGFHASEATIHIILFPLITGPVVMGLWRFIKDADPATFERAVKRAVYMVFSPVLLMTTLLWCWNGDHVLLVAVLWMLTGEMFLRQVATLCVCWYKDNVRYRLPM